jgi:hypothetical protein
MNRLAWMDRPTGEPIRRYEHERPGDLVHVDIKKLGAHDWSCPGFVDTGFR